MLKISIGMLALKRAIFALEENVQWDTLWTMSIMFCSFNSSINQSIRMTVFTLMDSHFVHFILTNINKKKPLVRVAKCLHEEDALKDTLWTTSVMFVSYWPFLSCGIIGFTFCTFRHDKYQRQKISPVTICTFHSSIRFLTRALIIACMRKMCGKIHCGISFPMR